MQQTPLSLLIGWFPLVLQDVIYSMSSIPLLEFLLHKSLLPPVLLYTPTSSPTAGDTPTTASPTAGDTPTTACRNIPKLVSTAWKEGES